MKKVSFISCLLVMVLAASAQEEQLPRRDSALYDTLGEVVVSGFEQSRRASHVPFAAKHVQINNGDRHNKTSLVHGFNTVSGVRMEERSPGSYRMNIRGSSLRSPFGVRNIKVYWNDIPFTDPGGNTYFNQVAFNNFSSITIFKGPAGSLYGAGTGGLVLMQSFDVPWKPGAGVEYVGGSYGLHNFFATIRTGKGNNKGLITYAHNENDGYRVQSAMRRDNASWSSLIRISGKQELLASVMFTDMYYQTPGGLTKAEFDANPRAARPAGGGFPSAQQARAAIYQKNFLAGLRHNYQLDSQWSNTTSLYAAFAHIRNPAVRNYERRNEPHAGGRTTFSWQKRIDQTNLKIVGGGELQEGFFNTKVFGNRQGVSDTLQTDDDIRFSTYSLFAQADLDIRDEWVIVAGASLNRSKVQITRLNMFPVVTQLRTYKQEWAPRLSVLRNFRSNTTVFGILSKGFSPPSVSELLPSTGIISTFLEAETGTNYEAGIRQRLLGNKLRFELNGYYFNLKNTLVQRRDASGADFFINAGDTKQKGMELSADYVQSNRLMIFAAYSYSHYRYGSFKKDTIDFSGKQLPSVPAHTISLFADVKLNNGLYSNATYYYASRIFLNDANTASAEPYHLLGWRLGWSGEFGKRLGVNLYAGADNLLDEVYSLGNDINDPRGRYYNTAPQRNYYAGVALQVLPAK